MKSPKKKPAWIWAFEEGVLTIEHSGTVVSLGRYANRDFAAKAAALYIAGHADGVAPRSATRGKEAVSESVSGG